MEATQNPYQTPEGQLTVDGQGYGEINFFSPGCRIGRLRYLAHSFLFMFVASIVMTIFMGILAAVVSALGVAEDASLGVLIIISVICYVSMLAVYIIFMIQRLHDLNKSGWMSLLVLVPFVNVFFGLYLVFANGTRGANDYGLAPPPNRAWHWIAGLVAPVLGLIVIFGIMAAVAIPAYQDYVVRAEQAAEDAQIQSGDELQYQDEASDEDTSDYSDYAEEE
jgi:uncharacterized membrane protein YhaH (DUF805 family)